MRLNAGVSGENPTSPVTRLIDTVVSAGNTDFLSSNIAGSDLEFLGTFRIKCSIDTATTFSINEIINSTNHVMDFNGGSTLNADAVYVWDFPVRIDADYNFQLGAAATINILQIDYIGGQAV